MLTQLPISVIDADAELAWMAGRLRKRRPKQACRSEIDSALRLPPGIGFRPGPPIASGARSRRRSTPRSSSSARALRDHALGHPVIGKFCFGSERSRGDGPLRLRQSEEGSNSMLDRPTTREGWLARAAALKIEGRAFIDGAYVAAARRRDLRQGLADRRQGLRPGRRLRRGRHRPGGCVPRGARSRAASGATPTRPRRRRSCCASPSSSASMARSSRCSRRSTSAS